MSDPVLDIEHGKLKGKLCKTFNKVQFYSFKGIPYAKPPIGELRFTVPQPPDPWEGIKDATVDCNICAQYDKLSGNVIGDEDCLYLNVYTPILPSSRSPPLPVMFFIHGGGFLFGNGTDDSVHGPEYLIEKDVVVVSINHRLGILGFLSINSKNAPGNLGLRDTVLALQWVQKNIHSFGGDPGNVTIFGISAGGATVEYLLLSPMAKGLFHKAIAQSGSSLLRWAQSTKVKELTLKIPAINGEAISDDDTLLKYLKGLPTKELIMSSMAALATDEFQGGIHFGFVPTVEKPGVSEAVLDKSTYDLLSQGEFTKVPIMTGFCSQEGLLMLGPANVSRLRTFLNDKDFAKFLPFNLNEKQKIEINGRCKSIYLESTKSDDKETDQFGIDFFTDVDFLGGVSVATSLIAKNSSPLYFYEFSYDGGLNYLKKKLGIDRHGVCHGDDGGYILKSSILPDDTSISETDKLVRERIIKMWTNFAKFGDPTPKIDDVITTKWEPFAESGMGCLLIDDKLTMKYDVYPERIKLFEELYEKYYEP